MLNKILVGLFAVVLISAVFLSTGLSLSGDYVLPASSSATYSGTQIDAVDDGIITKAEIQEYKKEGMSNKEIDALIMEMRENTEPSETEENNTVSDVPDESGIVKESEESENEFDSNLWYVIGGVVLIGLIWFLYKKYVIAR